MTMYPDQHMQPEQRKALKLSSNPSKAVGEMIETITRLHGIYELETEALLKSDTKAFMALQNDKLDSARDYQDGIAQLLMRREEMKNIAPDLRAKLEQMQAEFGKLTGRNLKAIERMQKAMNRFGGTLREAAREAVKKERTTSYNANGCISTNSMKSISAGTISETA